LARREKYAPLGLPHCSETAFCACLRIGHDDVCLLCRVDDVMTGRDDHGAQLGGQRGIFGPDQHAQASRCCPLHGGVAHAAGRASMVACSERTIPPRIRRRSALRPMLSEAKCAAILRRLRVGVPLTVRTISPATMPALAAGPSATIDITITPLD